MQETLNSQQPENRRRRRAAGLVGAVAAVGVGAALATGGTFALWQDSAEVAGGQIQTGNLDVATVGATSWSDGTKTIDPATFKMVPSDKITGTQPLAIALDGDNLKAQFSLASPNGAPASDNFVVTYTVKNAETGAVVANGAANQGVAPVDLPQTKEARAAAGIPTTLTGYTGQGNYTVDMAVEFKSDTPDREDVEQALNTLTGLTATVAQVD